MDKPICFKWLAHDILLAGSLATPNSGREKNAYKRVKNINTPKDNVVLLRLYRILTVRIIRNQ
ncbi:MAG: hypothetical protein A2017_19005 [Lentisphaerae bacterium GWF2_44_16]|nr:MAG: hypothetical protein A2017_19005 [Lentisphaerae bacterium GWF2_44_16]